MKNPELKNLRVIVIPMNCDIDQSSSVEEILNCSKAIIYPVTDYFKAQNDEEVDLIHWSFLIDITTKEDWTGSNIEGIHQFNDVEPLYTIKYWKTEVEFNNGDALDIRDDYTQDEAVSVGKAIADLCFAYEIYETESGETFYHSFEN